MDKTLLNKYNNKEKLLTYYMFKYLKKLNKVIFSLNDILNILEIKEKEKGYKSKVRFVKKMLNKHFIKINNKKNIYTFNFLKLKKNRKILRKLILRKLKRDGFIENYILSIYKQFCMLNELKFSNDLEYLSEDAKIKIALKKMF